MTGAARIALGDFPHHPDDYLRDAHSGRGNRFNPGEYRDRLPIGWEFLP